MLEIPLSIQLQLYVTLLGHQLHQIFGLMDVELVHHEDPPSIRVGGDGLGNMGSEVFIGASRTYRRSDHPARCHLKVSNQTLRAVANVFVLLALDQPREHR
jgi:hypothetical protein